MNTLISNNIEHRKLTEDEVNRLISEAEESETRFLRDLDTNIYEFINNCSLVNDGLVVNGRPIYLAALIKDINGLIRFWTVVNSDIDCGITLTKYSKKQLLRWVNLFGKIYATMEKINDKNMRWVEWLGFKKYKEDDRYITYIIGE